jgi:hypothetical protein
MYPSARAGAMGDFQSTLRRESSWDGGFASRKAQSEIPNLHPHFAKHVQNASNCGVSIMKGIILQNSITCKGERWVVVHRHGVGLPIQRANFGGAVRLTKSHHI